MLTWSLEGFVSTGPKTFLTPEQYLEIERLAECKSEYYQGEMFAMSGASQAHNLIVAHLMRDLGQLLRGSPCDVYPSDMRVRVNATGLYTYPDVIVACAKQELLGDRRDTLLNPTLIVEVLSPSTEAYDRGRKFEHYQSIPTLAAYLLVSSDRVRVDLFTRQSDGGWLLTSAARLEDSIELPSIGCRLSLADLYEKVSLES